MQPRAKEKLNDLNELRQEATDSVRETAEEWAARAKTAGTAALDATKATYAQLQEKAVAGAKVADRTVRENPYAAVGVAFGIGLAIGFLVSRSSSR